MLRAGLLCCIPVGLGASQAVAACGCFFTVAVHRSHNTAFRAFFTALFGNAMHTPSPCAWLETFNNTLFRTTWPPQFSKSTRTASLHVLLPLLLLLLQGSSAPRDVRPSIHRCLIYLGDLARYTAQAAPKAAPAAAAAGAGPGQHPAAMPDWQRAGYYYRLAARVLPRSGNPHNQLAVMSVMVGEALRAVYHYARSLCVGIPFWTARENLLLLFEQNRARCVPAIDSTTCSSMCSR